MKGQLENTTLKNGVTLLIPALNEEKTIEDVINRCSSIPYIVQLVIINDGSTDNTKNILDRLERTFQNSSKKHLKYLTIIHHIKNKGKGAAIKNGLAKARGKYVMVQDADLEYFPEEIPFLFEEAEKQSDGIVFGSRAASRKHSYFLAILGNMYLSLMFNVLFGFRLADSYTCYKLMPRNVWNELNLKQNGFEIDAELISKLGIKGLHIKEIPISYNPRKYSEGKKINWKDLVKATLTAIKIRSGRLKI